MELSKRTPGGFALFAIAVTAMVASAANAATYRDAFITATYSANNGDTNFSAPWVETNDDNSASAGSIFVTTDDIGASVLQVSSSAGDTIDRGADLSSFASGTIDINYRRNAFDADDYVAIEVSTNNGSSYTEIGRITGAGTDAAHTFLQYDISSFLTAGFRVRLNSFTNNPLWLDNIQVTTENVANTNGHCTVTADLWCDDFNEGQTGSGSYGNNDGGEAFNGSWIEFNEADGAGTGDVRISTDSVVNPSVRSLNVFDDNRGLYRYADTTGYDQVFLRYRYRRESLDDSSEGVDIQIGNNTSIQATIATHRGAADSSSYTTNSIDITQYANSNMFVLLRSPSGTMDGAEGVLFDWLEIEGVILPANTFINGRLFHDVNGNGIYDLGTDDPISGVRVFNAGGSGEDVTDAFGLYSIETQNGTKTISVDLEDTNFLYDYYPDEIADASITQSFPVGITSGIDFPMNLSVINPDLDAISCAAAQEGVIVLDASESIDEAQQQVIRDGVLSYLSRLPGRDASIAIVEFGITARVILPYTLVTEASIVSTIQPALQNDYHDGSILGWTNWDAGLKEMNALIDSIPGRPDYMVFITDGQPNHYLDANGNAIGPFGNDPGEDPGIALRGAHGAASEFKQSGAHFYGFFIGGEEDTFETIRSISSRTTDSIEFEPSTFNINVSDWTRSDNFADFITKLTVFGDQICRGTTGHVITGNVFEDVNGDSDRGDQIPIPNATVRMYRDVDGDGAFNPNLDYFVRETTTNGSGSYLFEVLLPGDYLIAVNSRTLDPPRGYNGGFSNGDAWPEQTYGPVGAYCDDGSGGETNRTTLGPCYGGRNAGVSDDVSAAVLEHVSSFVVVQDVDVNDVDFGFSWNVVTHVEGLDNRDDDITSNRQVQGSLRQFADNSNAYLGENHMRFVPTVPATQSSGSGEFWRFPIETAITPFADTQTTIDGRAYSFLDGTIRRDAHTGTAGTGGSVGTGPDGREGTGDERVLSQVSRPELEIVDANALRLGLNLTGDQHTIRDISIYGFGEFANRQGTDSNIEVGPNANNATIISNFIGSGSSIFEDPGAGNRSPGDNIVVQGADNGLIQNNLIGFSAGSGVRLASGATNWLIDDNEVRSNALENGHLDGVNISQAGTTNNTVSGNLIVDSGGNGIDSFANDGANNIIDNTVTTSGQVTIGPNDRETPGIRVFGDGWNVEHNVIDNNVGAGIMVGGGDNHTLTQNSIYDNGEGATASGQIGIDLLAAGDNADVGTPGFVTLNDSGDADTGANTLLNFPVVESALLRPNGDIQITGFVRPGSVVEVFVADVDPSSFGEGRTYLYTATEGTADDSDAGTGSYSGPVNGIDQGADDTNRFSFIMPGSGLVSEGDFLTLTATNASGATSEFSGVVAVELQVFDFGDAPASYDSPSHSIVDGVYMGAAEPDMELAAQHSALATGDDNNGVDDEDGSNIGALTFLRTENTRVIVDVAGAGGYLQAWFDWNQNGSFEAGEQVAVDLQDDDSNNQISVEVDVPATATLGNTFARFRWSLSAGVDAVEEAISGEVEDYRIAVIDPPFVVEPAQLCDMEVPFNSGNYTRDVDLSGSLPLDLVASNLSFDAELNGVAVWANGPQIQTVNGVDILYLQPEDAYIPDGAFAEYTMNFASPMAQVEFLIGGVNFFDSVKVMAEYEGVAIPISDANFEGQDQYSSLSIQGGDTLLSNNDGSGGTTVTGQLVKFSLNQPVDKIVLISGKADTTGTPPNNGTNTISLVTFKLCPATMITGTVFEDFNYGGGSGATGGTGRPFDAALGMAARPGAVVELYDATGNYLDSTTTDANGMYMFTATQGTYALRVVGSTVTSSRPGSTGDELGVLTYHVDGAGEAAGSGTGNVGGRVPSISDNVARTSGVFDIDPSDGFIDQSIVAVTVGSDSRTGVDFGYNFSTVANTNDSGAGSLRQFIINNDILLNTGLDQDGIDNTQGVTATVIKEAAIFMVPTSQDTGLLANRPGDAACDAAGVCTFAPTSQPLGTVQDPAIIDGTLQAGGSCGTGDLSDRSLKVRVDGQQLPAGSSGLLFSGGGEHVVRGTNVFGFEADGSGGNGIGIGLAGNSNNNLVVCNHLGTNVTATAVDGGGNAYGVLMILGASNNVIGTADNADRNIASGNTIHGIGVSGAFADDDNNVIENNYVGTDISGTAAIGNGSLAGVGVKGGIVIGAADGTQILNNLISGNIGSGIDMNSSNDSVVDANRIGTDASGAPLGNMLDGIYLRASANTGASANNSITNNLIDNNIGSGITIGGASGATPAGVSLTTVTTNSITDNGGAGIDVNAASTQTSIVSNVITGNGTAGGDLDDGIVMRCTSTEGNLQAPAVDPTQNLIELNTLQQNAGAGVLVDDCMEGVRITQNSFANNGGLGIDLNDTVQINGDGVTINDEGDADTGANTGLNFPVFDLAALDGGILEITGLVTPGVTLELYQSAVDPTLFGEGETYLGSYVEGSPADFDATTGSYVDAVVGTNSDQNRFRFNVTGATVSAGDTLTAIAIDSNGNTSEFNYGIEVLETIPPPSVAGEVCYAVADNGPNAGGEDYLTELNKATGAERYIGETGTFNIESIAIQPGTNKVFAANANELGTLSMATGVYTPIGGFGTGSHSQFGTQTFSDVDGLIFDGSDQTGQTLYGAHRSSGPDILFRINPDTGAYVPGAFNGDDYIALPSIVVGGTTLGDIDDLAIDPLTGVMYGVANNGGSTNYLVRINLDTGGVYAVGSMSPATDVEGLSVDYNGLMYGVSGSNSEFYLIDKNDGSSSVIATLGNPPGAPGTLTDYEALGCLTNPIERIDIELIKTVSNATPTEGGSFSYTLTIENTGDIAATDVLVRDLLPLGIQPTGATASVGSFDIPNSTWIIPVLALNSPQTLEIQAFAGTGTAGATIINTAEVIAHNEPDVDSSADNQDPAEDDQSTVPLTVQPLTPPNLPDANVCYFLAGESKDGTGDHLSVSPADAESYFIALGSTEATGISTQPGSGLQFLSTPTSLLRVDPSTGSAATVGSAGSAVGAEGSIVINNIVELAFDPYDANGDVLYAVHQRVGLADILVRLNPATGSVLSGAFSGRDYVVLSGAPPGYLDIHAIAIDPADRTFYAVIGNGSDDRLVSMKSFTGEVDTDFGDLGFDRTVGMSFPNTGGTAVVITGDGDNDHYTVSPSPLSVSSKTDLGKDIVGIPADVDELAEYQGVSCGLPPVDLAVTKSVLPANVGPSQAINWTVTVTNESSVVAGGIVIEDRLGAGLTFDSAAPNKGVYDAATDRWSIDYLASGETATLQLTSTSPANASGQMVENIAELIGLHAFDTDSTPANNVAAEDDQDDAQVTMGALEAAPVCEGQKFSVVDWGRIPASLGVTQTDTQYGITSTVTVTALPGGANPAVWSDYNASYGAEYGVNPLRDYSGADIVVQFDRPLSQLRFYYTDLDTVDEIGIISGSLNGTPVTPGITVGPQASGMDITVNPDQSLTVRDDVSDGSPNIDDELRAVIVGFNSPVDQITISSTASGGFSQGLGDIQLCADFSDAPLPDQAAVHIAAQASGLYLGSLVDSDAGPYTVADATGDGEDDDGVLLNGSSLQDQTLIFGNDNNVTLNITTVGAGTLYTFFDFNADGDFDDTDEALPPVVSGGGTFTQIVTLADDLTVGPTFARFRYSNSSAPDADSPIGPVDGGEVEDYRVFLEKAGVPVSGSVYHDVNHDGSRDNAENWNDGTPVFVNLVDNVSGLVVASSTVNPGTGNYLFDSVAEGNYTLVVTDSDTNTVEVPPVGWLAVNPTPPSRVITVADQPIVNQNFGLFHGSRLTGNVIADTGVGSGVANDAVQNGAEPGIGNVTITATDSGGGLIYATTQTTGDGSYELWLSHNANNQTVVIQETNPSGFISTGGDGGTSGGGYLLANDAVTYLNISGTTYSDVDFFDVPGNTFTPDGEKTTRPGGVVFYGHQFDAGTAGEVNFTFSENNSPANASWGRSLFIDLDCNGELDAGEPPLAEGTNVSVEPDADLCIVVKVQAPSTAVSGAQQLLSVMANFSNANSTLTDTLTRTDLTRLGEDDSAGLVLSKAVDQLRALPGQILTYTVAYKNSSARSLTEIEVNDSVPAFTTFVDASCPPNLPQSLTGCQVSVQPSPGETGPLLWQLDGELAPGAEGTVTFRVRIDQ